jgi:hypothetical protein
VNARIAAAVLGASILVLDAGSAGACSLAGNAAHVIDTTLEDETQPEPPTDVSVLVNRGFDSGGGCGNNLESSCDDVGNIQLSLNETATDDQTTSQNMGYLVQVVDGTPPRGVSISADPVRALNGTELSFSWVDDSTDGQEVIAFSVTLTPVDEKGNMGSSSDPIRIYDPGSSEGCATNNGARSLDAALLCLVMAAFGRALMRRR